MQRLGVGEEKSYPRLVIVECTTTNFAKCRLDMPNNDPHNQVMVWPMCLILVRTSHRHSFMSSMVWMCGRSQTYSYIFIILGAFLPQNHLVQWHDVIDIYITNIKNSENSCTKMLIPSLFVVCHVVYLFHVESSGSPCFTIMLVVETYNKYLGQLTHHNSCSYSAYIAQIMSKGFRVR